MHGASTGNGAPNDTRPYSPVTLNQEWSTVGRLLFVVVCSCIGTTINGFFVAAFFVEHTLKRAGNAFLACIGLSDLIVTTAVMPVSAVVLLSAGEWDTLPLCHALQFLTEVAIYSYSLHFLFVSIETYYRLCRPQEVYESFVSLGVTCVTVSVFVVSVVMAAVGVYLQLDYDYCQRCHMGVWEYRLSTSIIFHAVPSILTIVGLIISFVRIKRRAREQVYYRRSRQYERDFSTTSLNITTHLLFIASWIPYIVVMQEYPVTSDPKFYHTVWIGVCRSVFSGILYCSINRNFRRAFAHLFYYCCCKSTLTGSFSNRHRRAFEYKSTTGDVRVHIMHQAVNSNSPQRGASSARDTQEL